MLCDKVDDGAGNAFVFNRVKYCPSICRLAENAGLDVVMDRCIKIEHAIAA